MPLQDQTFKSEWHKKRAMQQAERRLMRKMARKEANFTRAARQPISSVSLPLQSSHAHVRSHANVSDLPVAEAQGQSVGAAAASESERERERESERERVRQKGNTAAQDTRADAIGGQRVGDEDEEGEMESVPSSFLAEMEKERKQRSENGSGASTSDLVVLDDEGNR